MATNTSINVIPASPPLSIRQLPRARGLVGFRIAEPHVDGLGRLTQPRKGAARRADDDGQKLDPVRSWRQDACGQVLAKLLDRISSRVREREPTDAGRRRSGRSGARRRLVPAGEIVLAEGVYGCIDDRTCTGRARTGGARRVRGYGDREPGIRRGETDELLHLLARERVGIRELIGRS